ncbi:photoreceptor outer segment membrane glycoprotein 2-like [Etheostoma cragini]|uniref:photoreceptor outer segment membrane glycoprotein 2-like n=1 Tax=Etheostoma cragini TaxID=417921 RepID=UPI00155F4838|nr:photoreceptor outer segment membrane glycoprotein 2-like [Etheostoma cragini]
MAVGKVTFTKAERRTLAKFLWVLNWVSVVTGATLFGLGLFLRVEVQRWQEVMSEQSFLYAPHMLMSTGLAACAVNFLGGKICLEGSDAEKFLRWKMVVMPYVVCTVVLTACVLAGAVMCYIISSQLEEVLFLGLRTAMRYYKDTDTPGRCYLKRTLDLLQIQFQCCGNSGYRDWFQVQWVSNRYLDMNNSSVRE